MESAHDAFISRRDATTRLSDGAIAGITAAMIIFFLVIRSRHLFVTVENERLENNAVIGAEKRTRTRRSTRIMSLKSHQAHQHYIKHKRSTIHAIRRVLQVLRHHQARFLQMSTSKVKKMSTKGAIKRFRMRHIGSAGYFLQGSREVDWLSNGSRRRIGVTSEYTAPPSW
ncbi:hypothetical protein GGR57DRAFT_505106 [Xylariaceae sp. FL1272]|nr:hypothetical protein GGR57DRAFT_505106 [Xylariaceae sp. FL1272]